MLPVVVNMLLPRQQRQVLARLSALALVASLPLLYVSLLRPPPAKLAGDTAFWFLMSNCVIGVLFFGSSSSKAADSPGGRHDDDNLSSYLSGGQQTAVAFEEASCTMPSGNSIVVNDGGPLPYSSVHAPVLVQRGDEDKDKNNVFILKGQGQEEIARPSCASGDEAIAGGDELAMSKSDDDRASLLSEPETEPEPDYVEEEELPEAWAIAQHSRTPDLEHGKKGSSGEAKLRRSVTEGSKPAAAEDSDYWELSDEELNRRVEEFIARFKREMRRQVEQEAGV